jgi:glycerophosphoryl diester phosphodiesterase
VSVIMIALQDASGTIRALLSTMRQSAWPLFLTAGLYRIVAFVFLTPLLSGLTWLFLAGSGRIVVTDQEILEFFLEPLGFLALLVIAAISLTLIALEQSCLMTLVLKTNRGTVSSVVGALRYALFRSLSIIALAGRIVIRVLLITAPFLAIAGLIYLILLTDHDINYYLGAQPLRFKLALAGGTVLAVGLIISLVLLTARVVLALPILLFEGRSPRMSLEESAIRSRKHRVQIAMGLCVWALASSAAVTTTAASFVWLGQALAPLLLRSTTLLVPVLGALFSAFGLAQLLVGMAVAASFSLMVLHWYSQLDVLGTTSTSKQQANVIQSRDHTTHISGRWIAGGAALSCIIASITGWLLISNAKIEDKTEVMAHRGASGAAPENTMAAVKQAISDGAHWVEIDVQRTSDNQVVVVHDKDLMRISGEPKVVTETIWAELAQIDVGSWFDPTFADQRIPTLEALLESCIGRIKVNIELKYYGWDEKLGPRVIEIVEHCRMEKEVLIMSLNPKAVDQIAELRPDWRVGLLSTAALGNLARVDADFLAVHSRIVTPGFVRRIHRAGKALYAWTVNDLAGMTRLFGMGVDGLITDEPALAVRLLDERSKMNPVERLLVTTGLLVVGDTEHVDPRTDGI